jgi:hypothetical protein
MTSGLFVPNSRRIGAIVAQVTISEQERDELVITEHPVEQGSPINDHAYKRPSEVTIRAGWSSSKAGDLSANGNGVYAQLLSWQAALRPFDLYTGKRSYKSMLIQSLMVSTDNHSEYALMADIVCRQVIIVSTKVTQAATNSDPSNQADPASNATPVNNGVKQATDVGSKGEYGVGQGDYGAAGEYGAGQGDTPNITAKAEGTGSTAVGTQVENAVQANGTADLARDKFTGQSDDPAVARIPPAPDTLMNSYVY